MSLDLSALSFESEPVTFGYDARTAALYALGVGAGRDELDYYYAARGPLVLPTFATLPAYAPMLRCLERLGADPAAIVHAAQSIRLFAPLPPAGELRTRARVDSVGALEAMAEIVIVARTERDGRALCETRWTLLERSGSPAGVPRAAPAPAPPDIPDREPDARADVVTREEQAALFHVVADPNPLHVDPELSARAGFGATPPLQGLCTLGSVVRATIGALLARDPRRVRAVHARFRRPVVPGETLTLEAWREPGAQVVLAVGSRERPQPVLSGAYLELDG